MPTAFTTRERRRIIQLFQQGLQGEDVAEVMGASASGVRRVYQQYREEGRDTAAYANCGPKPTLDEAAQETLRELARARPDAFCRELAEQLHAATGVRLSRQRVGVWLGRLGLTQKKSLHASEQERHDVRQARQTWMERLLRACDGDFSRVLFLDETGALTNATRTYGRCEQGRRCVDRVPAGHWRTLTAIAAIRLGGLTAAATTPNAMDGELFLGYLQHALLPALRPGDVVVMDNLRGDGQPAGPQAAGGGTTDRGRRGQGALPAALLTGLQPD